MSPLASVSYLRPNFLHPPFNDVRARRALALAVNQPDFMAAGYGTPEWWRPTCFSFFGCDTPNGTEVGSEPYRQQNLERARALLRESGYNGERIVLIGTTELPAQQALAEVAADALRRIGAQCGSAADGFRGGAGAPAEQGGSRPRAAGTSTPSALSGTGMWTPLLNVTINTNCEQRNYLGWPCNENIERLRAAYAQEPDAAKREAILEELARALWDFLPVVLTGTYYSPFAWRREVTGVIRAAPLVFWNIEKR